MIQKEIYASIEFVEQEIRFVLGEFHNSRLNILNVEIFPTSAIINNVIVDEKVLIEDIKSLIQIVNDKMRVNVKRVIVVLPSNTLERYTKRLTIGLFDKELNQDLIVDSINGVSEKELSKNQILVDYRVTKYFIDGVAKNKIDFEKPIRSLAIDTDLYAGSTSLVYEYLNIVESAGLEIIDISFESIAMASEMAAFEASKVKNIIIIRYEYNQLVLSLVSDNRVVNSICLNTGYKSLMDKILKKHNLSKKSVEKLILSNDYLSANDTETLPIFIYSDKEKTVAIDDKEVKDAVIPVLFDQFEEVYQIIDPILMAKETDIYLAGKGASIVSISDVLTTILKSKVRVYVPEIVGARRSGLVANLGALYLYRDESVLSNYSVSCVDGEQKVFEDIEYKTNEIEDSMTNRFKELFKIN